MERFPQGMVVGWAGGVAEQLGRLGVAEGDGARRQVQLGEDRRGPGCRDTSDPFVELDRRLEIVGNHADRGEVHGVAFPSWVVYFRHGTVA